MVGRVTYHWERHCAVCDEVVVKAWQVCAAAVGELNRRLHIDTQAIAALNHIQHLLFGLFQQLLLNRQVLDDGGRVVDAGRSCDIVKRGIVRQRARGRRRQEPGVRVAERHDAVYTSYLANCCCAYRYWGECCSGSSGV